MAAESEKTVRFVEKSSGGEEAIAGLNGSQLDGHTLTVNEAKPHEQRPRNGGSGRRW